MTIRDFPNYLAFKNGRIESLDRFEVSCKNGTYYTRKRKGKILNYSTNHNGYKCCVLYKNGYAKNMFVHRVILNAFSPRPSNKYFVNHKNGIKDDNRLENLEWVTCSQNTRHGYKNGLMNVPFGVKHHNHKISEYDVKTIRQRHKYGEPYNKIAENYPIKPGTVRKICLQET